MTLDLDRLEKIIVKLADPNPGTRDTAVNGFNATLKRAGVDVRDLFNIIREAAPPHVSHDARIVNEMAQTISDLRKRLSDAGQLIGIMRDERDALKTTSEYLSQENLKLKMIILDLEAARTERRTKLESDLRAEIARLTLALSEAANAHPAHDPQEADNLRQELAAAHDTAKAYQQYIADLETTLEIEREVHRPEPDEWHDLVVAWLAHNLNHRHATVTILEGIGIPEHYHDAKAYRRLANVMRAIGDGWEPSPNIPHDGARVRGYMKSRY